LMKNDVRQRVLPRKSVLWLRAVALAVPIILAACVISDSDELTTSVVIRFDEHGLSIVISLDRPVWLPIDEDDAFFIMQSSECACQGRLSLVGDYWQYPEYPDPGDCIIRINIYTGDVDCFSG
jgi:hypothetical protein